MPRDFIEEQALIDLSRCQREALERWMRICVDIGEAGAAEECRQAMAAQDMDQAA